MNAADITYISNLKGQSSEVIALAITVMENRNPKFNIDILMQDGPGIASGHDYAWELFDQALDFVLQDL
jgi:hypothetical protein